VNGYHIQDVMSRLQARRARVQRRK